LPRERVKLSGVTKVPLSLNTHRAFVTSSCGHAKGAFAMKWVS
jgi:hypothetical protein